MTHFSHNFTTYAPCPSNRNIAIADGLLTTIEAIGNIKINPSFILKNILHVPKLSINLVSINELSHYTNCNITLFSYQFVFQDEDSRMMIR